MPTEIQCIQRSLRRSMEDLHLVFTNDASTVDLQYYNKVNLALLQAEASIKEADAEHTEKMREFTKKHLSKQP